MVRINVVQDQLRSLNDFSVNIINFNIGFIIIFKLINLTKIIQTYTLSISINNHCKYILRRYIKLCIFLVI